MATRDREYSSSLTGGNIPINLLQLRGRGLRSSELEEMKTEIPPSVSHSVFDANTRRAPGEVTYDANFDKSITKLEEKIQKLHNEVEALKRQPSAFSSKITSIPSEKYELKEPIDVIIKIDGDEVIAMIPDLELYGEGCCEIEAVNDLKLELIDLLEDLEPYPDENLGRVPKAWNKTLKSMINRCQ
jgi:CRISPR/Cas system-associated endoribonuclease Cas2